METWYTNYPFEACPHCRVSDTLLKGPTALNFSRLLPSYGLSRPHPSTVIRPLLFQNPEDDLEQLRRRSDDCLLVSLPPSDPGVEAGDRSFGFHPHVGLGALTHYPPQVAAPGLRARSVVRLPSRRVCLGRSPYRRLGSRTCPPQTRVASSRGNSPSSP